MSFGIQTKGISMNCLGKRMPLTILCLMLIALSGSAFGQTTGYIYTGGRGTQAFDTVSGTGKALYRHLDDYVDATDLYNMQENSQYYFFWEQNQPGWYWAIGKHPTYQCGCCCGYAVYYVQMLPGQPAPRLEFKYYAKRHQIKGIIPHVEAEPKSGRARP